MPQGKRKQILNLLSTATLKNSMSTAPKTSINASNNILIINSDRTIYLCAVLFLALLAFLSFNRSTLNYTAETDFLAVYVPEAIRFLKGNPLTVEYHLPLYSITLALIYLMIRDWFASGLILSLISSFIVIVASYHFFKMKFGKIEGLGAILGLAFSWTFVSYSMQASSDMFFVALFFSALALIALADRDKRIYLWLIAGIAIGMAIITRTNGFTLILFWLFPFATVSPKNSKKKIASFLVIGTFIPIFLWLLVAKIYGSPIYPQANHKTLAVTYYSKSGGRNNVDALMEAGEEFSNTWQVLAKNPKHVLRTYIKDFYFNTTQLFSRKSLIAFPAILFSLPGLILLFLFNSNKFKIILAVNLFAMFCLLNLHAWNSRFYMYMVPFLGAGVLILLSHIFTVCNKKGAIITAVVIFIAMGTYYARFVNARYYYSFYRYAAHDAMAASKVITSKTVASSKIIISRKPHLRFYSHLDDSQGCFFPLVKSISDLRLSTKEIVDHQPKNTTIYLFYGYIEREWRPQVSVLWSPEFNIPWLKRIGQGNESGGWVLYEILPDQL
jgi:MFS family permease